MFEPRIKVELDEDYHSEAVSYNSIFIRSSNVIILYVQIHFSIYGINTN